MGDPAPHDSELPGSEDAPTATADKASAQLVKMVGSVIDSGVGPFTGSIAWAEDRLSRVQGARYVPNNERTRPHR